MPTGTWALGWATADIVSAAEFAKGTGCIYNTTLGVAAASIDVTGIVGSYAHLKIVYFLRSDSAVNSTGLIVRLNGDSGANYNSATAGTTSLFTGTNATMPGANETAGVFGTGELHLPNYAGTVAFKTAGGAIAYNDSGGTHLTKGDTVGGTWKSTSAVTRVTVSAGAGNLLAGSRLSIYAMGS